MERNYPEIIISDEGVTWLDKGQMWMYKNNLEQCDPQIKNGELVDIGDTQRICEKYIKES